MNSEALHQRAKIKVNQTRIGCRNNDEHTATGARGPHNTCCLISALFSSRNIHDCFYGRRAALSCKPATSPILHSSHTPALDHADNKQQATTNQRSCVSPHPELSKLLVPPRWRQESPPSSLVVLHYYVQEVRYLLAPTHAPRKGNAKNAISTRGRGEL